MKKNNERVNPGYKMTPLGVIPEDWEVKRLSSFAKIQAGATPSTTIPEFWGGDIRWMNSGELNFKKIHEVANRITEKGLKSSSTKVLPVNCVLIGLAGQGKTRGTVAINKVELCTNQSIAAVLPNECFEPEYIYYNLDNRYKELRQLSIGDGGRGGLNLKLIGSVKLPLPPLSEQKAVAKLLSTWDAAIDKTRQLIEQKELRKKALMQQLLTGKKRLKGFTGEWKEVRLGSVFSEILNTNNGGDHEVMTISARRGFISQNAKFNRVIAGDSLGKYKLILYHDFAYNKGNSITYKMGCIYRLEDQESAVVPFVYICFRSTPQVCSNFYKHWFLASGLDRQLNRIITSGARSDGLLNVNSQDFFALRVIYPTLEEQKAIGEILQKADEELILEKQKLEQLKLQKKSLMQVLLTGKKRLKI